MKIGNNYKIALAFTILPFVICRFIPCKYSTIVMIVFSFTAVLSIIIKPIGDYIYNILSRIGKFIGAWIAKIILFFAWIFTVLPIGYLMKMVKRDRLKLNKPDCKSYWVDNKTENSDYEYQF